VRDGAVASQYVLDVTAQRVAVAAGINQHMRGQRRLTRSDLPDVQVVDLGDRGRVIRRSPRTSGSTPAGAASRKIRPESRTSPVPALTTSATTTSDAIVSARVKRWSLRPFRRWQWR
jgi:hypothetical protein